MRFLNFFVVSPSKVYIYFFVYFNLQYRRNKQYIFTVHLQVVDKHLNILAKQHIETRFVKIQAEKSPFLAEKLKIVVLPTLALIKKAKVDDYVVCYMEGYKNLINSRIFFF